MVRLRVGWLAGPEEVVSPIMIEAASSRSYHYPHDDTAFLCTFLSFFLAFPTYTLLFILGVFGIWLAFCLDMDK